MPKVDKRPIGENSPNLATLLETDLKKNQPFFWKEHFAFFLSSAAQIYR
jgi:hypothetical protein